MHLLTLRLQNIRAIAEFEMSFSAVEAPGWHVLLGANGAGKSSVVRALALVLAGPKEAAALRQPWDTWVRHGGGAPTISAQIGCDPVDVFTGAGRRPPTVKLALAFSKIESDLVPQRWDLSAGTDRNKAERTVWGTNSGWFSASFGPFRRFSGGDKEYDRLFLSNPRLAPHLSAFGEDVALTEGLRWLRELFVSALEKIGDPPGLLEAVIDFVNASQLLPHGVRISEVTSSEVRAHDGGGATIAVEQLSDGYRSVLSMIFEILRQMARAYGLSKFLEALKSDPVGAIDLPGIIAIDEVDAHLHPSWQDQIGPWFTRCFPKVQFIVTTHSPIVCRAARTIWRLAAPGSGEPSRRITGADLQRLTAGSIIDAYGTELFGQDVGVPVETRALRSELAALNRLALRNQLAPKDQERLDELQAKLPTTAASLS
jgi:hypothetical protein